MSARRRGALTVSSTSTATGSPSAQLLAARARGPDDAAAARRPVAIPKRALAEGDATLALVATQLALAQHR